MKITSLELTQFRRFESFRIEFDDRMTVLVGENSSGKTAVADAAAVAIGTFLQGIVSKEQRSISKEDVRLDTEALGSTTQVKRYFPASITAEGSVLGRDGLRWTRSLNTESGKTTWGDAKDITVLSSKVNEMLLSSDSSALVLPLIAYYGTGRLWQQQQAGETDDVVDSRRIDGYKKCLNGKSMDKGLADWMRRMSFLEFQEERRIPELDAVQHAIEACYERFTGEDCEVRYSGKANDVMVRHKGAGKREGIPLRLLSDGYRTMLGLVADISRRAAMLNPQLGGAITASTPGVVIIDEVDLHLHPKWQVRVLGDLLEIFPAMQFIVTTHAPSIISSVQREHIRILGDSLARIPASQTYGRETSSIYREVMGAPERT